MAPNSADDGEGIDPELAALKTVRVQRPEHLANVAEARAARQADARVWLEQAGRLRSYRERAASPEHLGEARRLQLEPPETGRLCPVTQPESSEARNTATRPISSG